MFNEPWNAGSIRVAEKCGPSYHELVPEQVEVDGGLKDMLRYGIDS